MGRMISVNDELIAPTLTKRRRTTHPRTAAAGFAAKTGRRHAVLARFAEIDSYPPNAILQHSSDFFILDHSELDRFRRSSSRELDSLVTKSCALKLRLEELLPIEAIAILAFPSP
jgi:hypothetical protein